MVFYAFSTKFTAAYKNCSLAWGVRTKLGVFVRMAYGLVRKGPLYGAKGYEIFFFGT